MARVFKVIGNLLNLGGLRMTAEIVIMNNSGIAMAADSTVTVSNYMGERKTYDTANKLYSLSKYHPVGIMIYGNSEFMGIPWESIIKVYRETLGSTEFDSIKKYTEHFLEFLVSKGEIKDYYLEGSYIERKARYCIFGLIDAANELLQDRFEDKPPTKEEVLHALRRTVDLAITNLAQGQDLEGMSDETEKLFKRKYGNRVRGLLRELTNDITDEELDESVVELIATLLHKDFFDDEYSGVVISGFGRKEIYPSLMHYKIDGVIFNQLRCKYDTDLSFDSYAEKRAQIAIKPFAQQEMVHSFVRGINPDLKNTYIQLLDEYFELVPELLKSNLEQKGHSQSEMSDDMLRSIRDVLTAIRGDFIERSEEEERNNHVNPLINMIGILPKEELAPIAKALVNLTSSKQKVSAGTETVGGPIDVALISKGDGLVWIDRKHYFNAEKNFHFFQKYLRGELYVNRSFFKEKE